MISAAGTSRHFVRVLIVCEMLGGSVCLRATERDWIARQAQIVIIGTLHASPTFPWFDGWHGSGVIIVDEVLYGGDLPRQIDLRFVCKWRYCEWWPRPHYDKVVMQTGLWFFRSVDRNNWEVDLVDSDYRPLSDRAYWENYIRLYKW
jgi:hypothetical protein